MSKTKKRVLFHSEASYLNTGYSNYGKEVISRLIDSGKYEVAELSNYGTADDPRRASIPWKNYPVAPKGSEPEEIKKLYNSNPANQFGAWRFERACLDFKPDIFCGQMDSWMESWVRFSPYRPIVSWAWASTVDGAPQNSEWINQFASTDYFYTLSDWGTEIIKEQGGDSINHIASVTACAPSIFKPCPNKFAHRISMGINPEWNIIGTVMRNQRRKLFPDLFEMFGKYLKETGSTDTYLYCHTSYPDNGWDIPNLLVRNGIASKVLFTYACANCENIVVDKFSDTLMQCKKCKRFASKMSNVSVGATTEQLGKTYQVFDLYFQCANSEGIGMPQIEAAACGIPIMSVDYSAMSDVVRKLKGYPVPLSSKTLELETGCYRAIPDQDAVLFYWKDFFSKSKDEQAAIGLETRKAYETNFSWDRVVDSWMISLDDCPIANWNQQFRQINIPEDGKMPQFSSHKDFLDWAISTYLPYSGLINSYESNSLLRDLNFESVKRNSCGYFYSEVSYFDRVNFTPFHRQDVINIMKHRAEAFNFWEKARAGYINFQNEDWL
jgi:glycosyltransferase involved in cell wall biosynthesis